MGVNQQASADTTTNQNSTVGQNLQETNDQQDLQAKQVVLTNTPADQQEQANQENETAQANTQVATTAERKAAPQSEVQAPVTNSPATPTVNDENSQFNTADWNVAADNTITLKNQPDAGSTVYVPNSVDFGHEVILTRDYVHQLTDWGVHSLIIDHNGNGTVKAKAGDWAGAFAGNTGGPDPAGQWVTLDLEQLDMSDVTSMYNLFKNNPNLVTVGDITHWNVGQSTSFAGLFGQCPKYEGMNGSLDLSNWDTHSVRDVAGMFSVGNRLKSIDLHGWNISSLVDAHQMFNGEVSPDFNPEFHGDVLQSIDISGWHTDSDVMPLVAVYHMFKDNRNLTTIKGIEDFLVKANNVTDFNEMFMNCPSLTSLDLSRWNTSKVSNLREMFANDTNLQEVKGMGNWDASQVQDMVYTFQNCINLTNLGNLANFDQAHNLNNLIGTFMNTPKLTDQTTADSIANWDTSYVGSLVYTFLNNGFQKLDLSHWNTSSVSNFALAFSRSHVKNLNINGWDFSHGGVISMLTLLANPALINMNDITLPTEANRFKVSDFNGDQPIIVISNQLPLSLNNERLNDNTIGRQNSNKLTFVEKVNPSNIVGTKPMDFVFASVADFQKAIAEATDKGGIKATIGDGNSERWEPQSGYDLTDDPAVANSQVNGKGLHTANITEPTSFPEIVAGIYQLTMAPVTEAYTIPIIYRTPDVREISRAVINGTLSNGSATLASNTANNTIQQNLPAGYDYVSGLLTADLLISSSINDPIYVIVAAQTNPDNPDQPDQPDHPVNPDQPGQPDQPNNPDHNQNHG